MITGALMTDGDVYVLPDGRRIGYAQCGSSDGVPIFFVPGYGHSRLARGRPAIVDGLGGDDFHRPARSGAL